MWLVIVGACVGVLVAGVPRLIALHVRIGRGRREQTAFLEGLAARLEELSILDATGELFQLSENVRKFLRRQARLQGGSR